MFNRICRKFAHMFYSRPSDFESFRFPAKNSFRTEFFKSSRFHSWFAFYKTLGWALLSSALEKPTITERIVSFVSVFYYRGLQPRFYIYRSTIKVLSTRSLPLSQELFRQRVRKTKYINRLADHSAGSNIWLSAHLQVKETKRTRRTNFDNCVKTSRLRLPTANALFNILFGG